MRRVFHPFMPFMLAAVLAIGSVGFAKSRHAGQGVDSFVICTGYGLVTITVDETGKRVAEGVPCPDSIVLGAGLLHAAPSVFYAHMAVARVGPAQAGIATHGQALGTWRDARAPPNRVFDLI